MFDAALLWSVKKRSRQEAEFRIQPPVEAFPTSSFFSRVFGHRLRSEKPTMRMLSTGLPPSQRVEIMSDVSAAPPPPSAHCPHA